MTAFNFDTQQVSPEWINQVLRENGFIEDGEVLYVDQSSATSITAVVSQFHSLTLYYSEGSSGRLPTRILLKTNTAPFHVMGHNEAQFYERVDHRTSRLPLATCYGTELSVSTQNSLILLEDLSETHAPPATQWPTPPPLDQCKMAIAALAEMHASSWNLPRSAENATRYPEHWALDWIVPGGDMHQQHLEFMTWAESYDTVTPPARGRQLHDAWMSGLHCRLLSVDGAPIDDSLTGILSDLA